MAQQLNKCRERGAYQEAGHALALCLVWFSGREKDDHLLRCLTIDLQSPRGSRFPLPEGSVTDPWTDALIQLAGLAAEDVACGERLLQDLWATEDWKRAERLLRGIGMRDHTATAFLAAKALLGQHRCALDALGRALLKRQILSGPHIWALVQATLIEGTEPAGVPEPHA
jgi:hypothetical protein